MSVYVPTLVATNVVNMSDTGAFVFFKSLVHMGNWFCLPTSHKICIGISKVQCVWKLMKRLHFFSLFLLRKTGGVR